MCRFTAAGMVRVMVARVRRRVDLWLASGCGSSNLGAQVRPRSVSAGAAPAGLGWGTLPGRPELGCGSSDLGAQVRPRSVSGGGVAEPLFGRRTRAGRRAGSYFARPSATSRCSNSPYSIAGLTCDSRWRSSSSPRWHSWSITAFSSQRSPPSGRSRSRERTSSGSSARDQLADLPRSLLLRLLDHAPLDALAQRRSRCSSWSRCPGCASLSPRGGHRGFAGSAGTAATARPAHATRLSPALLPRPHPTPPRVPLERTLRLPRRRQRPLFKLPLYFRVGLTQLLRLDPVVGRAFAEPQLLHRVREQRRVPVPEVQPPGSDLDQVIDDLEVQDALLLGQLAGAGEQLVVAEAGEVECRRHHILCYQGKYTAGFWGADSGRTSTRK